MVNLLLQTAAYVLNIAGGLIMLTAICLPNWKELDVQSQVLETQGKSAGLFQECTYKNTGHWDCRKNTKWFFARESWWLGTIFLAISSVTMWFINILGTLPGLSCTVFLKWNKELTRKVMFLSSAVFVIIGLMNIVSSSIYASIILIQYQDESNTQSKFQWGKCIYLAWISGLIHCLAGTMQYWSSREDTIQDEDRGSQLIVHTTSTKKRNGKINQMYTPDYI